jgi:hypothetical protein
MGDGGEGITDKTLKSCERVPAAGPARVQSRLVKSEGSEQGLKRDQHRLEMVKEDKEGVRGRAEENALFFVRGV